MITNTLEQFISWLDVGLVTASDGEDVDYSVGLTLMPTAQGMSPGFAVSIAMKGLVLGETVQTFSLMPTVGHTKENIIEWARENLETLRAERSKQAAAVSTSPTSLVVP